MDFLEAYSSALSSDNSKSDHKASKNIPNYVPFEQQPAIGLSAASAAPAARSAVRSQGASQQPAAPAAPAASAQPIASKASTTGTSFASLFDDAIYVFRKSALQAVEFGIQEMLQQERQKLLGELDQTTQQLQRLQEENERLSAAQQKQEIVIARDAEIKAKLAAEVSDLKIYARDALYGQRVLKQWQVVAHHAAKSQQYMQMLCDKQQAKALRRAFCSWQARALRKQFALLHDNFNAEIQKMADEREVFFAEERQKYQAELGELKKQMASFAVREKKMKDAMKQAFLRGINAISEEASCALDKSERLSMPPRMRAGLEAAAVASAGAAAGAGTGYGAPVDYDYSSDENIASGDNAGESANDSAGGTAGAHTASARPQLPEIAELTEIVEENAVSAQALQQTRQFDTIVQQPLYVASPGHPVAVHSLMDEKKPIGADAKPLALQKTDVKSYRIKDGKNTLQPTLAQRLRGQEGQKTHPSSMIYKESVKAIGKRVQVEKE